MEKRRKCCLALQRIFNPEAETLDPVFWKAMKISDYRAVAEIVVVYEVNKRKNVNYSQLEDLTGLTRRQLRYIIKEKLPKFGTSLQKQHTNTINNL